MATGAAGAGAGPSAAQDFSAQMSAAETSRSQPASTTAEASTTPVSLQDAVDAVKASFTAANQSGMSSARITLTPASLGGITISISQTSQGLVARVAADHPEAAQTLAQSGDDLKRSLEQGGVSLLRLDIGNSGGQSLASFTNGGSGGQNTSGGNASARPQADDPEPDTQPVSEVASSSTDGALVDVLA